MKSTLLMLMALVVLALLYTGTAQAGGEMVSTPTATVTSTPTITGVEVTSSRITVRGSGFGTPVEGKVYRVYVTVRTPPDVVTKWVVVIAPMPAGWDTRNTNWTPTQISFDRPNDWPVRGEVEVVADGVWSNPFSFGPPASPTPTSTAQSTPTQTVAPTNTPSPTATAQPTPQGSRINWQTETVTLEADLFYILADGKYFVPPPNAQVRSDPGSPSYTTLEATWHDQGVEMRLFVYFRLTDGVWSVYEARTYNGRNPGNWIFYYGFSGNKLGYSLTSPKLELTGIPREAPYNVPGKVYFEGLKLSAFTNVSAPRPPTLTGPIVLETIPEGGATLRPGDTLKVVISYLLPKDGEAGCHPKSWGDPKKIARLMLAYPTDVMYATGAPPDNITEFSTIGQWLECGASGASLYTLRVRDQEPSFWRGLTQEVKAFIPQVVQTSPDIYLALPPAAQEKKTFNFTWATSSPTRTATPSPSPTPTATATPASTVVPHAELQPPTHFLAGQVIEIPVYAWTHGREADSGSFKLHYSGPISEVAVSGENGAVVMLSQAQGEITAGYGFLPASLIRNGQKVATIRLTTNNQVMEHIMLVVHENQLARSGRSLGTAPATYFVVLLTMGDADGNGRVTILDFSLLAGTFGKREGDQGFDTRADFDRNGAVTILDFSILATYFGLEVPRLG